eukprot:s576_g15.t1
MLHIPWDGADADHVLLEFLRGQVAQVRPWLQLSESRSEGKVKAKRNDLERSHIWERCPIFLFKTCAKEKVSKV